MPRLITFMLALTLPLAACGPRSDDLQVQMNKIRVMVKQSVAIAVQAACAAPPARSALVHAAAVSLRRATAGPEMARIHRMMGQMEADKAGRPAGGPGGASLTPQQKMHLAIHTAGGDGFDLLDALTRKPGLSCRDVDPVGLADAAALLREQHDRGADATVKKLDDEIDDTAGRLDAEVHKRLKKDTPAVVRALALALQQI